MYTSEQKNIQEGKPIRSEKIQESETRTKKDVKTLNQFFVNRSLFIKIHMIYRKLIPTYSGLSWLVRILDLILILILILILVLILIPFLIHPTIFLS